MDEIARGRPLDDRDRSDAKIVTWSPVGRAQRRLVFVPRASDGPDWERVEQVRREDGSWHTVGQELVATVTLEAGTDA
jgi:hypothetical protein